MGLIWLLDAHALGPILIRAGSKPGNEARMSKPDGRIMTHVVDKDELLTARSRTGSRDTATAMWTSHSSWLTALPAVEQCCTPIPTRRSS